MYIWLNKGGKKKLCEHFSRSSSTISNALNFKSNWQLHCLIRSYAVNVLGGLLIQEVNEIDERTQTRS